MLRSLESNVLVADRLVILLLALRTGQALNDFVHTIDAINVWFSVKNFDVSSASLVC